MCIIADELVGQGRIEGRQAGLLEGRQAGILEGRQEGQLDAVCSLVKSGLLKLEDAATFLNVSIEELCTKIGQVCA